MGHVKNHPLDAKERALCDRIDAFVNGMKAANVDDAIEQFNERFGAYASILPLHAPEEGVQVSASGTTSITYGVKNQSHWPAEAAPAAAGPKVVAPKVDAPKG